jgi:hypothetical protein
MIRGVIISFLLTFLILVRPSSAPAADSQKTESLLIHIKAVGREGAGNREASKAWRELVRSGPESLPTILAAFDGADKTVANWLRIAVDAIAERTLKAKHALPAAELEAFILKKKHDPAARRLAYEWLVRVDAKAPERLLPGMLQDPSVELRRDAVDRVLQEAQQHLAKKNKTAATATFQKALTGARDQDQVTLIAKELKTLGVEVDLAAHFGFIQKWRLIGPFDSRKGIGFAKVYPPEKDIDLTASYPGKAEKPISWTAYTTREPNGHVDLNKVLGKHMGVVGYAFAAVNSPTSQSVEIHAGSLNAVKIFLNGKQIYSREEYHHGIDMDQHIGFGKLRAGRNEILIKVCQNEQTEDWAQDWAFQLRVCDAVGGAVPLKTLGDKMSARPTERKVRP